MTIVKTRIKQHPLDDETLETPEHDEMVLWLLDEDNVCKLFPGIRYLLRNQGNSVSVEYTSKFMILLEKITHNDFFNEHKLWDLLYNNESLNSEFIDSCIEKSEKEGKNITQNEIKESWNSLCKHYTIAMNNSKSISIESEVPITSSNGNYVIGFWDVIISVNIRESASSNRKDNIEIRVIPKHQDILKYYIEVKPKITSFGKTLRQINLYKTYICGTNYELILITKDSKFREAFGSQNIIVKTLPLPEEPIKNTKSK